MNNEEFNKLASDSTLKDKVPAKDKTKGKGQPKTRSKTQGEASGDKDGGDGGDDVENSNENSGADNNPGGNNTSNLTGSDQTNATNANLRDTNVGGAGGDTPNENGGRALTGNLLGLGKISDLKLVHSFLLHIISALSG